MEDGKYILSTFTQDKNKLRERNDLLKKFFPETDIHEIELTIKRLGV